MASGLEGFVNPKVLRSLAAKCGTELVISSCSLVKPDTVSIVTADGRNFVGTLKGFDQTINIILDDSHERVYSTTQGVEQVVLGLHIIRGDNIAVIGELDESIDSRIDLSSIRAEPLGHVVH